jgi:hypothetical protein
MLNGTLRLVDQIESASVRADAYQDAHLFRFLERPVDLKEPARIEIAHQTVKETGIFDERLETTL